jgi:hypothetical protein
MQKSTEINGVEVSAKIRGVITGKGKRYGLLLPFPIDPLRYISEKILSEKYCR